MDGEVASICCYCAFTVFLFPQRFWKQWERQLVQTTGVVLDLAGPCLLCIHPDNDRQLASGSFKEDQSRGTSSVVAVSSLYVSATFLSIHPFGFVSFSLRWRGFELTPLTGPKASRICRWTSASQGRLTTPSRGAGERDATALAAMATMRQVPEVLRRERSYVMTRQDLNPTPLRPIPAIQGPLRPLSRSKCPRKRSQRLLQIPTCLSLWTTLGRTSHLLTSPQMLRVINYS